MCRWTSFFGLSVVGLMSIAAPVLAADLSPKIYTKAPPVAATTYNWSGCYAGIEGGGAWGHTRSVGLGTNNGLPAAIPTGTLKSATDFSGGLVGGTLGCNYQVNQWVFGIEGDGSWSTISGTSALVPPFSAIFRESLGQNWLATIRGRVGYAVTSNVLLYGTAGGAFADLRVNEYSTVAAANAATETHTFSGWTAGGGVEWGFAPSWSAKVEYLYADLGKHNYFQFTSSGCCTYQSTHLIDNIVRVGVNYHFNWPGALVARY
jgi:outer membrane immunogenic protein